MKKKKKTICYGYVCKHKDTEVIGYSGHRYNKCLLLNDAIFSTKEECKEYVYCSPFPKDFTIKRIKITVEEC